MNLFILALGISLCAYGIYIWRASLTEDGKVLASIAIVAGIVLSAPRLLEVLYWIST